MSETTRDPPRFDTEFKRRFAELVRWRRDVRRFRSDAVAPELVEALLALPTHAPSVGFSQPWRFVLVESPERRAAISANFELANQAALAGYGEERRAPLCPAEARGPGAGPGASCVLRR